MTDQNERSHPRRAQPWTKPVAFEAWKHYAGTGGADKDRITIATWLLSFSAAIIGFTLTQGIERYQLEQPLATGFLAVAGLVVSFVAAATTLVHGEQREQVGHGTLLKSCPMLCQDRLP